jgi:hypothetical protein
MISQFDKGKHMKSYLAAHVIGSVAGMEARPVPRMAG